MNGYSIKFEKAAVKFIKKQDKPTQTRLLQEINKLPYGSDIKKLSGFKDLYRLRVGSFRILFTREDGLKIIDIQNIDSRGQIYKHIQK